ncbi:toxic cation resistance protein [Streptomyces carminius]|uniref:Toxic cation resistance protein n=1 Tax=Streptomyces carminius TaxID=2665496 RepID=A0A2M8MCJ3_9ACTN|nr:VWA domain-containing protein [Streptomyces carminius]PJE97216.1 toxic cation resistance protein [Streptomyces carminius]PJF01945.1 toxic cation resistance protein [Streptomyces carminius]
MNTTALAKGANAALATTTVTATITGRGLPLDVSALLLGPGGTVRSDSDLVFYNHPRQDGVTVSGRQVVLGLPNIPADVETVVLVASADPLHPGGVFTTAPALSITQMGGTSLGFTPPDFTAGETVIVLAELYRRSGGWKIRAVGQGYASGLATDYGVDIEADTPAPVTPPRPGTGSPGGRVDLAKVENRAPALVAPARQAGQALARAGATERRAAVYLILDHGWDMEELYESLAIQAFAERVLALSVNLDDDGTVPVIFSSGREPFLEEIRLDNYRGRIGQLHTQVDWGAGDVAAAMRAAVQHYQHPGATDSAFIITQVGDEPWDKAEVRSLLQNTAPLGVFWLFVGFGRGKLAFYKNLNASASATFTNAAFYDAGKNPGAVPGEAFYAGLVDAYTAWTR